MLILLTGYLCKSRYEWGHHVIIGKRVGLTDQEIRQIRGGPEAPGWSTRDATILRAADKLHVDQMISDPTWRALCSFYDEQRAIELVFLVGLYTLVSSALNTLGVQLDSGVECDPDFPQ